MNRTHPRSPAWPGLVVLALIGLAGVPCLAQQPTEPSRVRVKVAGTFVNRLNEPMGGATITLTSQAGGEQRATTDGGGNFEFELPPGVYDVSFELEGFEFAQRKGAPPPTVEVLADGSLAPPLLKVLYTEPVEKKWWREVLIFLGIAAAGGAVVF